MTEYYEYIKAWKWLQGQLQAIPDPSLRKLYHDTFVLKAIKDWGFNPEHPDKINTNAINKAILDDQDKRLLERIKAYIDYGVDIRTDEERAEEKRIEKENKLKMYQFIKDGGTFADLPDDFKHSKYIRDLYFEQLKKVYEV